MYLGNWISMQCTIPKYLQCEKVLSCKLKVVFHASLEPRNSNQKNVNKTSTKCQQMSTNVNKSRQNVDKMLTKRWQNVKCQQSVDKKSTKTATHRKRRQKMSLGKCSAIDNNNNNNNNNKKQTPKTALLAVKKWNLKTAFFKIHCRRVKQTIIHLLDTSKLLYILSNKILILYS